MTDEAPLGSGRDPASTAVEPTAAPGRSPDALAEDLTRRYWDRLRFFAMRRVRDAATAEDVAQETLKRGLEALRAGRVQNLEAMPAFLFQTARNVCMHHGRSLGRGALALQRLGATAEEPGSRSEDDPLQTLITEERRVTVRKALDRLGETDRRLLLMVYVELLDIPEVARRLQIQPGAARVRKHRALRRMAELLGEMDPVTDSDDRELKE